MTLASANETDIFAALELAHAHAVAKK